MGIKEQIELATKKIVETVHPDKIYLFGSYAKEEATKNSDIDFLVIMPDRSKKKYQLVEEIEKSLRDILPISQDIVVEYADRYKRFHAIPYSFIGHIVKSGVLLYES
ncbi:MAG: nucleotidyltransferase domain-containing protein [Chitinophagaceae bacterium]|nr:nucleotidyltransferase domain-containing protein [Chitinophagaceae bacterium]